MVELPDPVRNRRGCLLVAAILALFLLLYLLVGINARPGNSVAEKIPTVPTSNQ